MLKTYSTELNKLFDSQEEAEKAESLAIEAKKKAEEEKEKLQLERKANAQKVEEARKEMIAAQKKYEEEIRNFINLYGSYHYSTTSLDDMPRLFDLDWFFKF